MLALVLSVSAIYGQTGKHGFLPLDDGLYVTENPIVLAGLSWKGIGWAFTSFEAWNWHPLTWLSHMLDVELFGPSAGWHHRVNVLFHLLNTEFLFLVLWRMTGGFWQSAFVAALFGVHPLHVESVAWVAERKDVLSTLFWILTMGAYLRYVRRPGTGRYLLLTALFALGLMCKPMLVTLPFVLLLLDFWPLGRMTVSDPSHSPSWQSSVPVVSRLVWEKVPLLALSAASCMMTFLAQEKGGSVAGADYYPFWARSANALVSYAVYLGKSVFPTHLGVYYPHPGTAVRWGYVLTAGIVIVAVSLRAVAERARRPYLLVGWLWFLGTLIPVIGLIQVGEQALADRYTYIPLTGIFLAAVWGGGDAAQSRRLPDFAVVLVAFALVLAYSTVSWRYVRCWRDGETLFRHTLGVTSRNWLIAYNLGYELELQGKSEEALGYYRKSISINPDYRDARRNLGSLLLRNGEYGEAAFHFREILRLWPRDQDARINLGVALWLSEKQGDFSQGNIRKP